MINPKIFNIFKKGSRTYFYSSKYFPDDIKSAVFTLYSFVRIPDDFVDTQPPKTDKFLIFKKNFILSLKSRKSNDLIIDSFLKVMDQAKIDNNEPLKFLEAMQTDLTKTSYQTLQELEDYMLGSAEVIGLMMAKIMKLKKASYPYAKLLGKSMQFINFIRDINHDLSLGRQYLPQEDLNYFGLKDLNFNTVTKQPDRFIKFINFQIDRYEKWQKEAEIGFSFIPTPYLIPIKTASDLYYWTAQQIKKNPFIVYKKRLKPSIKRIEKTVKINQIVLNGTT